MTDAEFIDVLRRAFIMIIKAIYKRFGVELLKH